MKKRMLSILLIFVLAISLAMPVSAADLQQTTEESGEQKTVAEDSSDADSSDSDEETESEGEKKGDTKDAVVDDSLSQNDEEKAEIKKQTNETESNIKAQAETETKTQGDSADETTVSDQWTAEDFTYTEMQQTLNGCDYTRQFVIKGRAIAGFSESGEKKLESNKHLVVPSKDDSGETLIGIADGAFKEKGLESVELPKGMMVDYDDTVTHVVTRRGNFIIGTEAFAKNNLTEVDLPEGVIAIMPSAFKNNQIEKVSIPHTVWWIENSCFAYNNLSTVGFPKTCDFQVQIHAFAFAHNNIKSVRLPDYCEVVEKKVFYWNPGMEECPAEAGEKEQSFGGVVYMYTDNAKLADMERIHHIERTAESQKSWHQKLIVGSQPAEEGAWTAADFTFDGTIITGLSESGAAKRAENKNLVLPDKTPDGKWVTEIASTTAGNGLFAAEAEGFESVDLPSHIEKIGQRAFANSGLKKVVTFPSTLKEIGIAAFQMNHLSSVILPDSVTTVGGGAFGTNAELEKIILSENMTEVAAGAFGCSDAKNYMTKLTELTIPEGITKIGANAFAGNNIKDIVIPSTVTEIGNYAFSTKEYLTDECTLTLSEGLKTIGQRAFRNKVINEVKLPSTVTGLRDKTFEKVYSSGGEAVVTKVYVSKAQYMDKENFPESSYHTYEITIDENDTEWDAFDFTYGTWEEAGISESEVTMYAASQMEDKIKLNPYLVTGLSDFGKQKLEKNKHLVIPETDTNGKKVTGIGPKAFYNTDIESVTLPEGVMADYEGPESIIADGVTQRGDFIICKQAFDKCKNLANVTLPEGVIRVGMYAFRDTKLTSVAFPHTMWWIENGAFARSNISRLAFEECDFKLNIMQQAFMANKIKAVQLPKRTEFLNKYTFMHNTGMEPIDASAPSTWGAGKGYGVVYLYADPAVASESFVHHYGTSGSNQSYAQKLITDEQMPEELKPWNVDDFTFEGTKITGLSETGEKKREFDTDLVLPDKTPDGEWVTELADTTNSYGLFGADGISYNSVVLPEKLVRIGNTAFAMNNISTDVKLPEALQEIGAGAFRQNNLRNIVIPDSVTTMGAGVYASNFTVETVKFSKAMTEIPDGMFSCSGQNAAENFTSVTIPEGVTKIGANAFAGNSFSKLELPSSVKEIGNSAFAQTQATRSLKEIVLTEGLEKIGRWAFRYTLASKVNIPSTLTELHKDAFRDNGGENNVIKLYTSNKDLVEKFADSQYHEVIYSNLVGSGWTEEDFTFDGSVLTGWSEQGNQTRMTNKTLILPEVNTETGDVITEIGDQAFKILDDEVEQLKDSVNSPNGMTDVVIPATVTKMGEKAFEYNNFKTVTLPEGLVTIGVHAFHGNQLESVNIPDSATDLQSGAFSENQLTSIKLPKELKVISQGLFSMNIRLEQIQIPDTVTEIGDMAFAGARLTSLTIPKSVTKIGRKAFHLHHLTELTIPGNVKEIGDSAFEGTFKAITLKKLTLGEGIESIGSLAFKEGYLQSVTLPNSLKSLASDAFYGNSGMNNDHVVVLYTKNSAHLNWPASTSHRIELVKTPKPPVTPAKPVKVSKIKITGMAKRIAAGKKIQLKATAYPSNAANKAVKWKVSNKKYAYVSKLGKVLLRKAGIGKTVTVTATAADGSGKKATYKIKIMKHKVKSIKLKSSKTLKAGKKMRIKATVRTTGRKANKALKWSTSNKKYAIVNSKGTVKAYKAGKGKRVKITARALDGSGKKKTVTIRIK